ncbi:glycine-rich RNA-binding protein 1-like [Corylus avellana]|uniref:glycine-rich RNA-binding protein 1-like n=1 Tax=Corylus avellana TaxID=13451 RepID=UPI001E209795|nr:glycine-rich RNA-binding protein 1-like [Corylus avellana]
MKPTTSILLAFFLLTAAVSLAARSGSDGSFSAQLKHSSKNKNDKGGGNDGGMGGFFGPGGGFGIPGLGKGWGGGNGMGGGYGLGVGGPNGGYAKGGVTRPTVVCNEKGPCYNKKLTCPAKCFTSYSHAGKGYGGGGGGGGCTMDCKKKCTAYC